jgi:NADPH:quinone reductase-like Zn-dependent oxidoreductase
MKMSAVYLVPTREGGVYEYRQVDKPEASGMRVLVKVKAAGTNRGELLMTRGYRSSNPRLKPVPSGIEFAGEIVEVGEDATGWHVGERVMARGSGGYAEYALAMCTALIRIPDGMSYAEAASIPNVFITSHDALITNAQLEHGENVVVTAAASGVGTASIQLAKIFGANKIIGTTRNAGKTQALLEVGATDVIDTSVPGYPDKVREITGDDYGADIIIDSVGGPMFADNLDALALRGRFVSVGRNGGQMGELNLDELAARRASLIGTTFRTRTPQEAFGCFEVFVEGCAGALADGRIKGIVDRTFAFDKLHDAHQYMLEDGQVGKIVLINE